MSLYNLLHGENPAALVLLAVLGLERKDIPRYRDCYWTGKEIAIHTRTGGGNRAFYENEESRRKDSPEYFEGEDPPSGPWNDDLRALPTFVSDEDDGFDSTYATFYFFVPEELSEITKELQAADATPAQKWQTLLAKMKNKETDDPQVKRAMEVMKPLFDKIIRKDS